MYNILICDDERDIVSALKIYLGSENYNIYEAYNGREALDILASKEIHLVLLDIMMPVLDGISALSYLRESSNVPVTRAQYRSGRLYNKALQSARGHRAGKKSA